MAGQEQAFAFIKEAPDCGMFDMKTFIERAASVTNLPQRTNSP